ncbi:MAG: nucleotide exchange factor GrpE [Candidatus Methanoperedens sp.]|nr:nucleotide exchange factor GrpE [Candidatus Methanoperedens sp.]MCE8424281.1 nucleotide exchange factor GrpE [Candidatus Methanoperedens sp.]MCE8426849.1 nucleotide exchange factor GrpE [Candidatus Methanoperedens sp.]
MNRNKEEEEIKETEEKMPGQEEPIPEIPKEIDELEKTKKQLEDEKNRCLRLSAEFDNMRKRTQKEKEEFIKYANEKLILELIDVWESLERGIENAKKTDDIDTLVKGMELIYKQFKTVLEKNGLVPIKAQGEKFDHYKHEAMIQTVTDECEEDMILEEFARGYMLNNKVIRYSKVRVSKKKEQKEEKGNEVN